MNNVLNALTPETRDCLHNAHSRYMVLVGIYTARDEMISDECAAEDKANFSTLIKKGRGGLPITDPEDFALFAGRLCECSREVCMAWEEKEFFDEHGMTPDEMDKKNKLNKERAVAQEAAAAFQNDKASGSTTDCPYASDTHDAEVWNLEYEFHELKDQGAFDTHHQ